MRNPVPRIAAIHDMSGFGRTSLTVAIPILSCMGIQVCPMPTAVLSTHTVEFTDYTLCDLTPELGGILDHHQVVAAGNVHDGVHLTGDTGVVHGDDDPRLIGDGLLDLRLVDVHRIGADVHKDELCPASTAAVAVLEKV